MPQTKSATTKIIVAIVGKLVDSLWLNDYCLKAEIKCQCHDCTLVEVHLIESVHHNINKFLFRKSQIFENSKNTFFANLRRWQGAAKPGNKKIEKRKCDITVVTNIFSIEA